jgi:hypothetical protein
MSAYRSLALPARVFRLCGQDSTARARGQQLQGAGPGRNGATRIGPRRPPPGRDDAPDAAALPTGATGGAEFHSNVAQLSRILGHTLGIINSQLVKRSGGPQ